MKAEQLRRVVNYLIGNNRVNTQKDLATILGYEPTIFSSIVNGRRNVPDNLAEKIASTFNEINKDWLDTGRGAMRNKVDALSEVAIPKRKEVILSDAVEQLIIIAQMQQEQMQQLSDKIAALVDAIKARD